MFKHQDFADRRKTAEDAKKALIERFKTRPATDNPDMQARQAERRAAAEARAAREAARNAERLAKIEAERAEREAKRARLRAEQEAEAARIAAAEAERLAREEAERAERAAKDTVTDRLARMLVEGGFKVTRDNRKSA